MTYPALTLVHIANSLALEVQWFAIMVIFKDTGHAHHHDDGLLLGTTLRISLEVGRGHSNRG